MMLPVPKFFSICLTAASSAASLFFCNSSLFPLFFFSVPVALLFATIDLLFKC